MRLDRGGPSAWRARVTPGAVLAFASVAVIALHTARIVRAAWLGGQFMGDDLVSFWLAHVSSLSKFVLIPIDVHLVPAHRLVTWLLFRALPMNFGAALAILLVLHGAGMWVLFQVLQLIRARALDIWLVCLYGANATLAPLFYWWTSGIHRLGWVCFSLVALYAHLRHRMSRAPGWNLAVMLATACALGFYEKGVLTPLFLLTLELGMPRDARRGRDVSTVVAAAAVVSVYLIVWRRFTDPSLQTVNLHPRFLLEFTFFGLKAFGPTLTGLWIGGPPVARFLANMGVGLLILYLAARGAARAVLSGLVALAASMLVIAASAAKTSFLGLSLLLVDRYYFECAFLFFVFLGVVTASARPPLWAARLRASHRWRCWASRPSSRHAHYPSSRCGTTFRATTALPRLRCSSSRTSRRRSDVSHHRIYILSCSGIPQSRRTSCRWAVSCVETRSSSR